MKVCARCGAPKGKGRRLYCGDDCAALAARERTRRRDDTRIAACHRCQGPKEPGVRGGRYCSTCREIVATTTDQMEYERARRRSISNNDKKVAEGGRLRVRLVDAPAGQKWCARCQRFRPLSAFAAHKARPASYCLPCQRAYNRERRVQLLFGLSWEEYEALLEQQGGKCAICDGRPRKNMLAIDHDHKTGEIRGLLCSRCNHKLLGSANDDPARLRKAADYLEQFAPREVFGGRRFIPGKEALR